MLAPSFICTYYWWLYFRQFEYFNLYWQAFCGLECPVLENVACAFEKKVFFRAAEQLSCAPVMAPVHLYWLLCTCAGSCAPVLAPVHLCWLLCTCASSMHLHWLLCTFTGSMWFTASSTSSSFSPEACSSHCSKWYTETSNPYFIHTSLSICQLCFRYLEALLLRAHKLLLS